MAKVIVLTKSESVMTIGSVGGENGDEPFVYFHVCDDDTGDVTRSVALDMQAWRCFGEPQEITVSIVPGNALEANGVAGVKLAD